MSFLYRSALIVTRKQPYVDWANGLEDGGRPLADELTMDARTTYLVPEFARVPKLSSVIDACWEAIFEEELSMWTTDESEWPQPRTRELFDTWFDSQLTLSVFDLVPEEPLTQADVDADDLGEAFARCAWCGAELEPEEGRFVGFALPDRSRFAHRQGLVLPIVVGKDQIVTGIMTSDSSEAADKGEDLVVRVCTSRCEKVVRKAVPKALKRLR